MDFFLQVWAGGFYLLNKLFFALAEGQESKIKRSFKLLGWLVYVIGVPAWVVILVSENDWIAASIEAGGIPSMLLGLFTVYKNSKSTNKLFDRVASSFTYFFLAFGVGYSLYEHGGIVSLSQILELGVMFGFLLGTYLLAKNNINGWLFFMLMNISMGSLMLIQEKPLLSIQQLISLCIGLYGYTKALKALKQDRQID